jgi:DNA-nicking Smr family endonuclease
MDETDKHDDRALFRDQFKHITRLRTDTVEPHRRRPAPIPHQTRRAEREVIDEMAQAETGADIETGEELLYQRAGMQHGVLRRLRRGQYAVQGELDLHGMRTDEAKRAVARFMRRALDEGWKCVRIVHGKGQGSQGRLPVLKPKLANWLARRGDVLAYCSARPIDGGTGAVYVLLRKT